MARERLILRGSITWRARAAELLTHVESRERDGGEFVAFGDDGELLVAPPRADDGPLFVGTHYLKGGPLRGSGARRHGWARLLVRRAPPRIREFDNLCLLRANWIAAAQPVVAAARVRGTRVISQMLLTERVSEAGSYGAVLASAGGPLRTQALRALAPFLARLHVLGFEHRDLFLRNLLYTVVDKSVVPVVLDLWRGGRVSPLVRWRTVARGDGAARDLGRLCTDLVVDLSKDELRTFLADYLDEHTRLGHTLEPRRFCAAITTAYRAEAERHEREPHRQRGRPPIDAAWTASLDPLRS